jgi:hypothetical protein
MTGIAQVAFGRVRKTGFANDLRSVLLGDNQFAFTITSEFWIFGNDPRGAAERWVDPLDGDRDRYERALSIAVGSCHMWLLDRRTIKYRMFGGDGTNTHFGEDGVVYTTYPILPGGSVQ